MMTIGSLFSGIGGLELGLEWAGVGRTVWQVERDAYCRRELAKHWPGVPQYGDVCAVGRENLEAVDVICGGFPCQDVSVAGSGDGLDGKRSGLWYEFARIVREMGPRYIVVENVAGLLTRGLDGVLGTLADLGYDAEWSGVSAADVGAPHERERIFIIAYREAVGHAGRAGCQECDAAAVSAGPGYAARECVGVGPWDDGVSAAGADGIARIIPRDAAERGAQSEIFPLADGFPGRMAQLRAIGNAVVPQVAALVGKRLLAIDAALRAVSA